MKIRKLQQLKQKRKIVCLTAYTKSMAQNVDQFCDLILVGDSMGTALYGMKNTHSVNMSMIINHAKSVRLGTSKSALVVDMPFKTYGNAKQALKNAKLIMKQTKCDAVKLESNGKNYSIIKNLVKNKIPVMGHIGYTPQNKKKFKPEGITTREQLKLLNESKKIEQAGSFSIVLECVSTKTAKQITEELKIPTIGIGSSKYCDGQVLVTEDLLGLSGFKPKFVKKYNNLNQKIKKNIKKFSEDVIKKRFPNKKHEF